MNLTILSPTYWQHWSNVVEIDSTIILQNLGDISLDVLPMFVKSWRFTYIWCVLYFLNDVLLYSLYNHVFPHSLRNIVLQLLYLFSLKILISRLEVVRAVRSLMRLGLRPTPAQCRLVAIGLGSLSLPKFLRTPVRTECLDESTNFLSTLYEFLGMIYQP